MYRIGKILSMLVFFFVLVSSTIMFAQKEEPHVITVVTIELLDPEDGSNAEFDSLNAIWVENAVKKNEFIVNSFAMSHLWGSNSSDFVVVTEYKNFADIEKAPSRNFELMREAIPDDEERAKYYKESSKYFGNHSDEIFQRR